jgi:hypothetical protein
MERDANAPRSVEKASLPKTLCRNSPKSGRGGKRKRKRRKPPVNPEQFASFKERWAGLTKKKF